MNLSNMNSRGMQRSSFLGFARSAGWWCAALALSALNGCASMQETPQDTVRKLASQRWQHVIEGKFDKAYEMTVPSFRLIKTKESFITSMVVSPVKWHSAEIVRVECEPPSCKVTIKAASQLLMPTRYKGQLVSGIEESWVLEDGKWWKLEVL